MVWLTSEASDALCGSTWFGIDINCSKSLHRIYDSTVSILVNGKAPNTLKIYTKDVNNYEQWCSEYKLSPFPINADVFLLYLTSKFQVSGSRCLHQICSSIGWVSRLRNKSSPCDFNIIKEFLKSCDNIKPSLPKPKQAITPCQLHKIIRRANTSPKDSFYCMRLRTATFSVLAFYGFFRGFELLNLRFHEVKFESNCVKIVLEQSKTSKVPNDVLIHTSDGEYCPKKLMVTYFSSLGDYANTPSNFLFPVLNKQGRPLNKALSYQRMLELIKIECKELGLDPKDFGLHSFRRGGASAAANCGISDRLFRKHGRWRSEMTKDKYVEESLEQKLSVTKMMMES